MMPVSSACVVMSNELVAKGSVTSVSDMLVGDLAAQGPVARAMKVIAWCVVLMKSWLLL